MRLRLTQYKGAVEFRELLKELVDNNYFRSGQELNEDDFLELVPSIPPLQVSKLIPPTAMPEDVAGYEVDEPELVGLEEGAQSTQRLNHASISTEEYFAIKVLTKTWVREQMLGRLQAARERIAARRANGNGSYKKPVAIKQEQACAPRTPASDRSPNHKVSSAGPRSKGGSCSNRERCCNSAPHKRIGQQQQPDQKSHTSPQQSSMQINPSAITAKNPRIENGGAGRQRGDTSSPSKSPQRHEISMPSGHLIAGGEPSDERISRATIFGEGATTGLQEARCQASQTDRQHRRKTSTSDAAKRKGASTDRDEPMVPGYAEGLLKAKAKQLQKLAEAQEAMKRAEEKVHARVAAGQHWRVQPPRNCDRPFQPGWGDSRPTPMRTTPPQAWKVANAKAMRDLSNSRSRALHGAHADESWDDAIQA